MVVGAIGPKPHRVVSKMYNRGAVLHREKPWSSALSKRRRQTPTSAPSIVRCRLHHGGGLGSARRGYISRVRFTEEGYDLLCLARGFG